MLKITVDIFSGRPNPSWIIDDDRGKEILDQIAKKPELIAKIDEGYDGLGYRGIHIELMSDESIKGIPSQFAIANGAVKNQKESLIIARSIVDQMQRYEKMSLDLLNLTPVNKEVQKIVFESIDSFEKNIDSILKYIEKRVKVIRIPGPIRVTVNDPKCSNCQYEESRYNPNFWNANTNVRTKNNCYNYARNWRTDTFAQPGRYSGQTASSMSCAQVKAAAMRDGLVERCNCLPLSEYPRRLMALVIAPGIDYHWYRKHTNGYWGHKPGGTAARNIDNSGNLVTNPETCDRGAGTYLNYTDFCGYFYAGKSVKIK
jgi:hypothetical protein